MLINVDVCVTDSDVSASWHFHNGSEQQITDDDERNGVANASLSDFVSF
jgi:hypothetical protein